MITPNSNGNPEPDNSVDIREKWSDAARAAALAARRARAAGMSHAYARQQMRGAFYGAGGKVNFEDVPTNKLQRGDRIYNKVTGQPMFNVKNIHQARAAGYLVVQGKSRIPHQSDLFGAHSQNVHYVRHRRNSPDVPRSQSLKVTAAGTLRRRGPQGVHGGRFTRADAFPSTFGGGKRTRRKRT
jgi:hypothetical protein